MANIDFSLVTYALLTAGLITTACFLAYVRFNSKRRGLLLNKRDPNLPSHKIYQLLYGSKFLALTIFSAISAITNLLSHLYVHKSSAVIYVLFGIVFTTSTAGLIVVYLMFLPHHKTNRAIHAKSSDWSNLS